MSTTSNTRVALPPRLALYLSRSPLLPSLEITSDTDDILATLLTKRITAPLPGLSFAPKPPSGHPGAMDMSSLSSFPSSRPSASSSDTDLSSCRSFASSSEKPLPSLPPAAIVSAKEAIWLLNLLDRVDEDIGREVERVKDGVREAHALVDEYKAERRVRKEMARNRRTRERRETKGVDSDFWLGI